MYLQIEAIKVVENLLIIPLERISTCLGIRLFSLVMVPMQWEAILYYSQGDSIQKQNRYFATIVNKTSLGLLC